MNTNQTLFLHLSLIPGVTPGVVEKLIKQLNGIMPYQTLYDARVSDLRSLGLAQPEAQLVHDGLQDRTALEHELMLLERNQIRILTPLDDEYPPLLKETHLPPLVLYVQGVIPAVPYIGCVGSRKANFYGQKVVRNFIPQIVASGVGIVSGGAYGIDAYAHAQAVEAGGVTVVVLGTGLLKPYPAENCGLFDHVVASGGAVISCFPLERDVIAWQFPVRNRIIAGMAYGTLVVQAAKKSGALITAEYALQEGRAVCAVPGSIDDPLSAGCHALISQGARMVGSGKEVLEECGFEVKEVESEQEEQAQKEETVVAAKAVQPVKPQKKSEKKVISQTESVPVVEESAEQDPLVMHCKEPITVADLSLKIGVSESLVQHKLFQLQLEGKVEQDFAGLWRKS